MSKKIYSDAELASCAQREVGMRRGAYPKFVTSGKLTQEVADEELAKMSAVAQRLTSLSKSSPTFAAIWQELERARTKFPSAECKLAALMEEVGELSKALLDEPAERIVAEAIQVAALAIRLAEEGDPTLNAYRAGRGLGPFPVAAMPSTPQQQEPPPDTPSAAKPSDQLTPTQLLQVVLNHPRITRREKTQCLLRLKDASDEQITEYVTAWRHTIDEREKLQVEVATPKQEEELPWLR